MKLDERFLKVHPRTAEWLAQRETCFKCANLIFDKDRPEMNCRLFTVEPNFGKSKSVVYHNAMRKALEVRGVKMYCIDARDKDGPCGPEARAFSPVVAPAAGTTDNSTSP